MWLRHDAQFDELEEGGLLHTSLQPLSSAEGSILYTHRASGDNTYCFAPEGSERKVRAFKLLYDFDFPWLH